MFQRFIFFLIIAVLPTPPGGSGYVHDFAGVLSQEAQFELFNLTQAIEKETTVELAVVTVQSLEGYTIDAYATELFNKWGIGKAGVNNGLLLLVAPNERRIRIEVGYGLEPLLTDSLSGEIIDEHIIPQFKAGKVSEGIVAGANALAQILRQYPDAARGVPGSAPKWVVTPRSNALAVNFLAAGAAFFFIIGGMIARKRRVYSPMIYILGSLIIIGLAGYGLSLVLNLSAAPSAIWGSVLSIGSAFWALIYNSRRFFRFGPHTCLHCGGPLQLLDEKSDDSSLTEVQQLEEKLRSVDYDVWVCSSCMKKDVKQYAGWFSGYSKCPSCTNRTFEEKSTVVTSATRFNSGLRKIDGLCLSCKHATHRTEIIPRITSSSSSGSSGGGGGGGSFGGGSSGGGGASRGW